MRIRRIAVTGASGNLGTALLREVTPRWDVVGVTRRPPERVAPYTNADWLACDIGAPEAPSLLHEAFTGVDAVVHLAWAIHPRTEDPDMYRTNFVGVRNVLAAARLAQVPHVVFGSSVAAYRQARRWELVDEDWPLGGVSGSAYSCHKAQAEALVDRFAATNPDVRVTRVRPAAVVQSGSGAEMRRWLFSPLMPTSLLTTRRPPLPLWPGLRLQLVHARDVASALRLVLERGATGAFNLAADPVLTASDISRVLGGIRVPVPFLPLAGLAWSAWRLGLHPLHPGWLVLADKAPLVFSARARVELGWTPEHDSASALAEVVAAMASGTGEGSPPLEPIADHGLLRRLRDLPWGRPTHQSQGWPART
ncbi:NAD-dependent epimerase/dehydratase family protein [Allokutzneria oryzae]|uniref:NAD-dependent epimerase/dehydratase family protein n=1 Tax=Allokutzneria oryzae TaxID=1378989 RepID=A0ABV5ZVB0_9PSEU